MRPTNPTPGHASGNGTPTPLRPTNPTPLKASTAGNPRPSNPTPKQASELVSHESPLQEDPPHWTTNLESVQEMEAASSLGEEVAGPVEAEDPNEDGTAPLFSGELEISCTVHVRKLDILAVKEVKMHDWKCQKEKWQLTNRSWIVLGKDSPFMRDVLHTRLIEKLNYHLKLGPKVCGNSLRCYLPKKSLTKKKPMHFY